MNFLLLFQKIRSENRKSDQVPKLVHFDTHVCKSESKGLFHIKPKFVTFTIWESGPYQPYSHIGLDSILRELQRNIWLKEQRWQLPPTYIGQTYFPYPTLANVWGTFTSIKSNMTSQFFADANCAKIHINSKYDKQFKQKGLSSLLILYQARTLRGPFDCLLTSLSLMLVLSQFGLVTHLQSSFQRC